MQQRFLIDQPRADADRAYMPPAQSSEWETPQALFDALHAEFGFTLDPCATTENAKCPRYFTKEGDGLAQSWDGEVVFLNPPYGRGMDEWVRKAAEAKATVVCLLPSRTDVRWFHDYVYGKAEIRFLRGRLKFGGGKNSAPFPSMVVVFSENPTGKVEQVRRSMEAALAVREADPPITISMVRRWIEELG